jgi:RNA polymerase-binding transcription factor DksA
MNGLTKQEFDRLAAGMKARKRLLMDEIQRGLARAGEEGYAKLVGEVHDRGDEAVADLLRDVQAAEVTRDVGEVRDIEGAQARIAAGRYALCTDCGAEIGYARLQAFPTAKRCIGCQENREKTKGSPPRGTR